MSDKIGALMDAMLYDAAAGNEGSVEDARAALLAHVAALRARAEEAEREANKAAAREEALREIDREGEGCGHSCVLTMRNIARAALASSPGSAAPHVCGPECAGEDHGK